ncbi:MAG: helix-hairpin-helix domain-containing protein [Bacteroides sp.]|nr:helix-hairpin-helix domain-containing protein [Bacteroides sp.]MCM1086245.1 helix-hairpin-helix domain-containing protein [Bacteroides sp.]
MSGLLLIAAAFLSVNAPPDSLGAMPENAVLLQQEDYLEELLENEPEEYEERLAEIQQYADQPLNLNTATEDELQKLGILDAWQIKALLYYRNSYGNIVRMEELCENVDGFDRQTLNRLLPFVCLENSGNPPLPPFRQVIGKGKHQLTARYGRVLAKSKAFADGKYAGTPDSYYLRYTFNYKNRIQWGFAARQGAGEAFTRQGFDFYSGYLALKSFGIVKNLTVGTYKANFGYGLNIHSPAGFFGGLQAELLCGNGKGFRPYASGAEYGYLQGAALQLALPKTWQAGLFYSIARHDAGLQTDSASGKADFWDCIQSFPETGYHRTQTEILNRKRVPMQVFGLSVEKDIASARIGMMASGYLLGGIYTPELRRETLAGKNLSEVKPARGANLSVYYRYLLHRFHFYGEAALSHSLQGALLQGIQFKPAETFALAVQYTWQSAGYHAPYATVGNRRPPRPSVPGKEKHLFSYQGKVSLPANLRLEFSGSERVEKKDAGMPVHSEVFTGSLYYEPRRFTACLRFRLDNNKTRKGNSIRLNAAYRAPNGFFGESRLEMRDLGKGVLLMQDAGYQTDKGGLRIRLRVALFHTEGYGHRIYAYEPDVRYSASAPALYGKGMRLFILLSKSFGKFTAEIKYVHTLMDGVQAIGSGDNQIQGFLKPEIKVQLHLRL